MELSFGNNIDFFNKICLTVIFSNTYEWLAALGRLEIEVTSRTIQSIFLAKNATAVW